MPIAQKNLEFDGPGRDGAVKSPARPVGWAGPDQHGLRNGPGQAKPVQAGRRPAKKPRDGLFSGPCKSLLSDRG